MPDESKKNESKTASDVATDASKAAAAGAPPAPAKTVANDRPQLPSNKSSVGDYEVDDEGSVQTGNLTRDAIIGSLKGKFVEQGKTPDEALELAVKRGFEMVKPNDADAQGLANARGPQKKPAAEK